tara:strand:+ start:574 stop:702 length:129 start_codon:yes stop_codon:yes gene_type:complete
MGQEINMNKPNITIGQANNHIDDDPEASAKIYIPNQKLTSPK